MKKIVCFVICILVFIGTYSVLESNNNMDQEAVAAKLIRFHVIANSDTAPDQALKMKVRDEVLGYISPKLKNSKNVNESRNLIRENDVKIKEIAEKVITTNGYKYSVKTTLGKENFPVKTYGNITLPQGEYEAYRIIIGNGSGQNWWCVMFPPLCFVDISVGQVAYEETEKQMKKVLTPGEYELVNNKNKNIEVKFKVIEAIRKAKKQKHLAK